MDRNVVIGLSLYESIYYEIEMHACSVHAHTHTHTHT